jgi:hypothetical protein
MRFEHTFPASERAKTIHALDRAATVTGICSFINAVYSYGQIQFSYLTWKPLLPVLHETETLHCPAELQLLLYPIAIQWN